MRKLRHWPATVPNHSAFRMPLGMVIPRNDHHSEGCAILNFCQNRPFDAFFMDDRPRHSIKIATFTTRNQGSAPIARPIAVSLSARGQLPVSRPTIAMRP